jgi:MraZ protein
MIMNNIFRGYFKHSLDAKGRVAIPNSYRRMLPSKHKGELYLNKGRDNVIEVHSPEVWERFEKEIIMNLSRFHPESLRLRRSFQANITSVKIDFQGRILIPTQYKEYAKINHEVIIAGNGDFFEIWNPDNFEQYQKNTDASFTTDLENIDKFLEIGRKLNLNNPK